MIKVVVLGQKYAFYTKFDRFLSTVQVLESLKVKKEALSVMRDLSTGRCEEQGVRKVVF